MNIPVFDISNPDLDYVKMTSVLHQTGCIVVRDPEVDMKDNEIFLDMMERYFAQTTQQKMKDARPELFYQVGCTPEGTELSRCIQDPSCLELIDQQTPENRAVKPQGKDPKWRYMYRIGDRDPTTSFPEIDPGPLIPEHFENEWVQKMDNWGNKLLMVVNKVTTLVEKGLGLDAQSLTKLLKGGPHLLAPTGTDVKKYSALNTVYASYHSDISFLTIHGKSRFPGLFIWLRDGRKVAVKVPEGCLLLQVGKQLEHATGGYFRAGYHEVICTPQTIDVLKTANTHWRVSSTLFAHVNSDQLLTPLMGDLHKYPEIKAGDFTKEELKFINLR